MFWPDNLETQDLMPSLCTCRAVVLNSGCTLKSHGSYRHFMLRPELPEILTQFLRVGLRCFSSCPSDSECSQDWLSLMWVEIASLPLSFFFCSLFLHLSLACFLSICKVQMKLFCLSFIIMFSSKWFFFFQVFFLSSDLGLQGNCWLNMVHLIHDLILTAAFISTVNLILPEKPLLFLKGIFFC